MNLGIELSFAPMEAQSARTLPKGAGYQFEPKWDGFRALCFRDGDEVALQSKSGQPLARYFPELVRAALALRPKRFAIDGEIIVPVDDRLAFDQLLQRIHPAASRVDMLSKKYPAAFVAFDMLVDEDRKPVHAEPLTNRRAALEAFAASYFSENGSFMLSPATTDRGVAEAWYQSVGGALDGIVAKRIDIPYSSGDRRGMLKIKNMRTADCVIGGFRAASDNAAIGSLLLGLYDDGGLLDYVGFTSGFSAKEKTSLFKRLSEMNVQTSFTGRTPGGPSRWNRGKDTAWVPVEPSIVLQVEFDHVSGGRFRHGTRPMRFRPDKSPKQCTMEQMEIPLNANALLRPNSHPSTGSG